MRNALATALPLILLLSLGSCDGDVSVDGKVVFPDGGASFATGAESGIRWLRDDFDRDGDPDYLLSDATGLILLANDGSGRFEAAGRSLTGPVFFETAFELPGDDLPDLLGYTANGPTLFENRGDGTFEAVSATLPLSLPGPHAFAALDLDGDGRRELAVVDADGVDVLGDDGTGNLGSLRTHPATWSPAGLDAADLDGDGREDLLVYLAGTFQQTFAVLLNRVGGFESEASLPAPFNRQLHALGDVDGDGLPDLVLRDPGTGLRLARRLPAGGFGPLQLLAPETAHEGLFQGTPPEVVDLTGDGLADLLLRPLATAFVQSAGGDFAPRRVSELRGPLGDCDFADVDGDGRLEQVAFADGRLHVRPTDPDTILRRPLHEDLDGRVTHLLAARIAPDARSRLLVITGSSPLEPAARHRLTVLGLESGTLAVADEHDLLPLGGLMIGALATAVGDFDGDGLDDLVLTGIPAPPGGGVGTPLWLFRGRGDGTLEPPQARGAVLGAIRLCPGDLDGDGDLDLVAPFAQRLLLNDGTGTFASALGPTFSLPAPGAGPLEVVVAPLDADAFPDVLLVLGDGLNPGQLAFGQGSLPLGGTPTFAPVQPLGAPGPAPTATPWLRLAVDGDPWPDYLDVVGGRWLRADAAGFVTGAPHPLPEALRGRGGLVGDLDGDGRRNDLLVLAPEGSTAWLGRPGLPGLAGPLRQEPGAPGELLADLDGDGRDDLVAGAGLGLVYVLRNAFRR